MSGPEAARLDLVAAASFFGCLSSLLTASDSVHARIMLREIASSCTTSSRCVWGYVNKRAAGLSRTSLEVPSPDVERLPQVRWCCCTRSKPLLRPLRGLKCCRGRGPPSYEEAGGQRKTAPGLAKAFRRRRRSQSRLDAVSGRPSTSPGGTPQSPFEAEIRGSALISLWRRLAQPLQGRPG